MENVDDAMRSADEAIEALKRTKPSTAAAARVKSAELLRLQQVLLEASRQVVAANAAKRISHGSNGHAQPVQGEATSLSDEVITALAEAIVPFMKQLIADAVAEPIARLAELEATATKYRGVWNDEESYVSGSLVTYQGGLWHCTDTNCSVRPGSGSNAWTLANKSRR